MNRKTWIVAIIAFLLIGAGIVWAAETYLSPQIPVKIEEYSLTLTVDMSTCAVGDTLNFSGTFTTETFIVIGQNITLWCNSTYTGFSNLTDSDGYYEIFYPATIAGTGTFYTNTTVT